MSTRLVNTKISLFAGSMLAAQICVAEISLDIATDENLLTPQSSWSSSLTTRTEAGQRYNVGLSAFNRIKSPYLTGGLDYLLFRLPTDGLEATLFLSGDHRHYFNPEITDSEQSILSSLNLRKQITQNLNIGMQGMYLFQDMVFDASSNDLDQTSVKAQANVIALKPSLRYTVAPRLIFESGPIGSRHDFLSPLDDYWEYGAHGNLQWRLNQSWETSVGIESKLRPYDNRVRVDSTGIPIDENALELTQHELRVEGVYKFGKDLTSKVSTGVAYMQNQDGGSGYYNYDRYRCSVKLRRRWSAVTMEIECQLARYEYVNQIAEINDPSTRNRTELQILVRPSFVIHQKLKWYLIGEIERAWSNTNSDSYTASTIGTGFELEFF